MDNFQPQATGHAGHEEGDFRVRGIILFVVVLVFSAVLAFVAAFGLMRAFEWGEAKYLDKPSTPVQQQLQEQRGELATKEGVKPQPDWYNRTMDDQVLERTFARPRLQADDTADMNFFLKSEEKWMNSTGKTPDGTVHIPIDQAIDLLSEKGLPAVNGTFTPQPPLGNLEAVAEAAKRRVSEANQQPPGSRSKK